MTTLITSRDVGATPAPIGARRRNPRGQGHRLREELIQAAIALLAETGDPRDLTLRAVATRAGIAAPSIYRHFPDIEHLKVAVVNRGFATLAEARTAANGGIENPGEALLAEARAYYRFAMDHPGLYQLMFGPDQKLPATLMYDTEQSPGRAAIHALAQRIHDCQRAGAARNTEDPFELAIAMWALEHGLVTLRMSRPHFPWPPHDHTLALALNGLLDLTAMPPPRRTTTSRTPNP